MMTQTYSLSNAAHVQSMLAAGFDVNSFYGSKQTALYLTCEAGYTDAAQVLLKHGADVNHGASPLIAAARNGHVDCVRLLLDRGANVRATNSSRQTAVDVACGKDHYEIVELLLNKGAFLSYAQRQKLLPQLCSNEVGLARKLLEMYKRHRNWTHESIRCAFKTGLKDMAKILVEEGRLNTEELHSYALCYSVKYNWQEIVVQILKKNVEVNNIVDGKTALYYASEEGHRRIVEMLLEHGGDPNIACKVFCNSSTKKLVPIQVATEKGYREIVNLLVKHGAIVSSEMSLQEIAKMSLVHMAMDNGHIDLVDLFVKKGCDINTSDRYNRNVLLMAASKCSVDTIKQLIDLGSDVRRLTTRGEGALHLALTRSADVDYLYPSKGFVINHLQQGQLMQSDLIARSDEELCGIVTLLLQHGAEVNVISNAGDTPLYRACRLAVPKIVDLLLKAGADPNLTSCYKCPLIAACEKGSAEIAKRLLEAGAEVNGVPVAQCLSNSREDHHDLEKLSISTSSLIEAVKTCSKQLVELLLKHGADITLSDRSCKRAFDHALDHLEASKRSEVRDIFREILLMLLKADSGNTWLAHHGRESIFYRACAQGFADVVEDLLSCCQQLSVSVISSVIRVACQNDHDVIVDLLIKYTSSPVLQNALHHERNSFLLHVAARNGNARLVGSLLAVGFNVHQRNTYGQIALHLASNAAVVQKLVENGSSIDTTSTDGETALSLACKHGISEVVSALLESQADTNIGLSKTPLFLACQRNHVAIVELLLSHGADVNASSQQAWGHSSCATALSLVCKSCNLVLAEKLLNHGANVFTQNHAGDTPLHLTASGMTNTGSESNGMRIVDLLLARGAPVNVRNNNGETPLFVAVRNVLPCVVAKLIEYGADVDITQPSSEISPLILACEAFANKAFEPLKFRDVCAAAARMKVVELLLLNKANVNGMKIDGRTPLFIAAEKDNEELVAKLIEFGADVNSSMKDKCPLITACYYEPSVVARLLLEQSSDVNVVSNGQTALTVAAEQCNYELVKALVEQGAQVAVCDSVGNTPLHYAVSRCDCVNESNLIKFLLQSGAPINSVNNEGETPLYIACRHSTKSDCLSIVEYLLARGADPNVHPIRESQDYYPYSVGYPLSLAVNSGKKNLVKLLLDSGALVNNVEANGVTALHHAVTKASCARFKYRRQNVYDTEIVDWLLSIGANVNAMDGCGETALYKACRIKLVQIAITLLQHKADPNLTTRGHYPLNAACESNSLEIVQLLLRNGAVAEPPLPQGIMPTWVSVVLPLCIAAKRGNVNVMRCLLQYGAQVNRQDGNGLTALHCVCDNPTTMLKSKECLEVLLGYNANINILSNSMESPLYLACKHNNMQAVEMLLKKQQLLNDPIAKQPLVAACRSGNIELVKLLLQHSANVNVHMIPHSSDTDELPTDFELPLCVATERGKMNVVQLLIESGANVNQFDGKKNTALYYAIQRMKYSYHNGKTKLVDLLLFNGADPNITNGDGSTPLTLVIPERNTDVVQMLLSAGANPNIASKADEFPISLACRVSHSRMVEVLLDNGADPNVVNAKCVNSLPIYIAVDYDNTAVIDVLLNVGVVINPEIAQLTQGYLFDFCIPCAAHSCDRRPIEMFKAGVGFNLLSLWCNLAERRHSCRRMSFRLCQAVVLAGFGFHALDDDLGEMLHELGPNSKLFVEWVQEDTKAPPSLLRLCRNSIRRQMSLACGGRSFLDAINRLPLPETLRLYIKYEGRLSEVDFDASEQTCEDDKEDDDYDPDASSRDSHGYDSEELDTDYSDCSHYEGSSDDDA